MIARRALLLLALAGAAGTPARAQDQIGVAQLREELMALELLGWESLRLRDRAAMRSLLPDDALQIYSDGKRYHKSEVLAYMPDYRLDGYEIEPTYAVRMINPTVAILLYRVTSRGAARFNRTASGRVLASSLYVRRDGKWWSVLYQETPGTWESPRK